jgi:hypothetical protein
VSYGIVAAARTYLAGFSAVAGVLGSDANRDMWLFQESLGVVVEGTGQVAAKIEHKVSWSPQNDHNTLLFPRLVITFYADSTRGVLNNVVREDAASKIFDTWFVFNSILHRSSNEVMEWGDYRIVKSVSLEEPDPVPSIDGDGLFEGIGYWGLQVG